MVKAAEWYLLPLHKLLQILNLIHCMCSSSDVDSKAYLRSGRSRASTHKSSSYYLTRCQHAPWGRCNKVSILKRPRRSVLTTFIRQRDALAYSSRGIVISLSDAFSLMAAILVGICAEGVTTKQQLQSPAFFSNASACRGISELAQSRQTDMYG